MGFRASCLAGAAALLLAAPAASAGRVLTVGYTRPAALHGLHVVRRVPALRVAEVRVADRRAGSRLAARPGIRYVTTPKARVESGGRLVTSTAGMGVPEWEWRATHSDSVPDWVRRSAANVTIAVVDTGADLTVPALAGKTPTTWNVATGSPAVSDAIGHGTFVAALAAGAGADPLGMSGFGGDARLQIVQANREGGAGFSDVDEAAAIVWAVDHGANIVNLSVGGTSTSPAERAAVAYATTHGVLLVAAAGNAGELGNPTVYPAALIGRAGLVAGAATDTGRRAPFSTTGSYVDLLAPGVDILSAIAHRADPSLFTIADAPGADGTYGFGTGTSFAAPEVAGAAALVWAANPSLSATGVADIVDASASGHGTWTTALGYGNLDVGAAVDEAIAGPPPLLQLPGRTPAPKPGSRPNKKRS
jgi:subtilisin family serine protease